MNMKRTLLILALIFSTTALASAQIVSYKLTGTAVSVGGGDYNARIRGETAFIQGTSLTSTGAFGELGSGPGFQAEIIVAAGKRLSVGMGGGYYVIRKEGSMTWSGELDGQPFDASATLVPRLSVIPFFLNLHYTVRLTPGLSLDFFAGPVFQIIQFNVENPSETTVLSTQQTVTFTASKTSGGGQGGLGLNLRLSRGIELVADAYYRSGAVADLKGNWAKVGTNSQGNIAGSSAEYFLWAYDQTQDGKTYARAGYFDLNGPTGDAISKVKKAGIDLGGVTFSAGIKVNF
jgi:hypothetical protein